MLLELRLELTNIMYVPENDCHCNNGGIYNNNNNFAPFFTELTIFVKCKILVTLKWELICCVQT